VRAAAGDAAPFDVVLDGIGRFPVRGLPNVVWLGAGEGADGLIRLGQRVRESLRDREVPFDDKPFRPHVTLARVKRDVAPAAFAELMAALGAIAAPSLGFRVDAVHVVESKLSPKGPRYASLQAVTLGRHAS
jgi:2'-5' RNA ligase